MIMIIIVFVFCGYYVGKYIIMSGELLVLSQANDASEPMEVKL